MINNFSGIEETEARVKEEKPDDADIWREIEKKLEMRDKREQKKSQSRTMRWVEGIKILR